MARLRVLLFSPLRGVDPVSGDTSYTESLLSHPPPGVEYTTYAQAIGEGSLRIRGRKPWHGRTSATDLAVFGARSIELAARRSTLMFREYIGYISVEPGAFDLIHAHLPALRQIGEQLPVVSSAGYPLTELYRWREQWSDAHLKVALELDSWLMKRVDAHNPWLRPTAANLMIVYSEHFRRWLINRGVPGDQVRVATTGLPDLDLPAKRSDGRTLGIVARDFYRKGGDVALAAFDLLRNADPTWHLMVATTKASADAHGLAELAAARPGVELVLDPDRDVVLREILPRVDVLLAPTRSDCGVPYTFLEALQAHTCIVTSENPWLDDRLGMPAVRRTATQPGAVAAAVVAFVDEGLCEAQGAAYRLWEGNYSIGVLHASLLGAYRRVVGTGGRVGRADGAEPASLPRRRILVAARPYDLSDAHFDGFVSRHRRMVGDLASVFDLTLLSLRTGRPDDAARTEVPGIGQRDAVELPIREPTRRGRLADALRNARGIETVADRRLAEVAEELRPDAVITLGPWLNSEYRPLWRRFPSVHLFEEDLSQMVELAPQSLQGRLLRRVESWLHGLARAQPTTVVSISPIEKRAAERLFPASAHTYIPYTLDSQEWLRLQGPARGRWVVAVGNFSEARNAEGLAEVLAEIDHRFGEMSPLEVMIVSGPGLHRKLERYVTRRWVDHGAAESLLSFYVQAWAALVPARRVTGQKTTILQAWASSVPVVTSPEAAATVGGFDAALVGADPAEMVDLLLRLRDDPPARERLARAGRSELAHRFDPAEQKRTLTRIVSMAVSRGAPSKAD